MKSVWLLALVLAVALVGCDDDTTSTDVVTTTDTASTSDVAADGTVQADTVADTSVADATAQNCAPGHTEVADSGGCLQDDALCYETVGGAWCTGTLASMLMAECEAIGGTSSGSAIDNTCPDNKMYLGSIFDVNCPCGCCL